MTSSGVCGVSTSVCTGTARRPPCESPALFVPLPPRKGPCRLEYTTVEKALRRYLKAAGVTRRVRFHDLRHTAGLRLANRGVPLQIIQDIMYHKDPRRHGSTRR